MLLSTDVDGTITIQGKHEICINSMRAIRELRKAGVKVILNSGNSLPFLLSLYRYLGVDYVIAENGCVYYDKKRIVEICENKGRDLVKYLDRFPELRRTTFAEFRKYDLSYKILYMTSDLVDRVKEITKGSFNILITKNTLHIIPKEGGKGVGLRALLKDLSISDQIAAIGDSLTDLSQFKEANVSGAVSDSDPRIFSHVTYVMSKPACLGFDEFVNKVFRK
ncbi:phosphoglycolate phosphatase [Sulfolobales archaeon HS-7]|nr:phosphoglycolate phosphatase [Sulfolobales archaeon HS-7]